MDKTKEIKVFDESTLADAMSVVREAFSEEACNITKKMLRNPVRKVCSDAGSIGYCDGQPVAFQAAMLRRLYLGNKEIFAIVGGQTSKIKGECPLALLLETIAEAKKPRNSSIIGFGNTSCVQMLEMSVADGAHIGPVSGSKSRWGVADFIRFVKYAIKRKIFRRAIPLRKPFLLDMQVKDGWQMKVGRVKMRRIDSVAPEFFNALMDRYLKSNNGIVSSRRADELEWMFGDRIKDGRALIIGGVDDDGPLGYALVSREDESGLVWKLLDMLVVGNDVPLIRLLLKAARKYLSDKTPALKWTVTQFPDWVQPVFKRFFPFENIGGFNRVTWSCSDIEVESILASGEQNWYFCPYDGDLAFF